MNLKRLLPFLFIAAVLGLAACGSDDGSDGGGDGESGDGGSTEVAAPGAAAAVCGGEANSAAPEYAEGSAEVAIYTDGGDGYEFSSYAGELPEGTEALIPEQASVIVCMEVTDSEIVDSCEFEDDESGETFTQELADATYDVRVLVAQSGEEIDTAAFSAKAGDCGIIASFTPGEGSRVEHARPGDELKKLLAPYTG